MNPGKEYVSMSVLYMHVEISLLNITSNSYYVSALNKMSSYDSWIVVRLTN